MSNQGVEITCKLTTTNLEVPSVVAMGIGWNEDCPIVCFAARSDLNLERCVLGALEELQLCRRFVIEWIGDHGVADDSMSMRQMGEFYSYYCRMERLGILDFVKHGPSIGMHDVLGICDTTPKESLEEVVRRVGAQGYDPILVDITPVDVAQCGLTVTRAIVPGLRPVTFSRDFRHLGGSRLYEAPIKMGVRKFALAEEALNPNPMPGG